MVVQYIKDHILNFPLLDITTNISDSYIDAIYRNPNPAIYMINLDEITEKDQNVLLKFVEEPLRNSFIILICESRNLILNTILNRCIVFELDKYTVDELIEFIPEGQDYKLITPVFRTPGKIKKALAYDLNSLYSLCSKMIEKIKVANFSNTLTIASKINVSGTDDTKYDVETFFDTLLYCLKEQYIKERTDLIFSMYRFTLDYRGRLNDKRLNKDLLIQNFLTGFWKLAR